MFRKLYIFTSFSVLLSFSPPPSTPQTEIAIIVNSANPIERMRATVVKDYWLKRYVKRWKETNKGILPTDRKARCDEQDIFYSKVLGLPPATVETYLRSRQYQTGDYPPEKFTTDEDIINYIAREAGAII